MGKIGDLWVKLGLKNSEFNKGMAEAKNETKDFGESVSKMSTKAKVAWAAVSAAVVKVMHDAVKQTQAWGDKWNVAMTQMKAGYQVFLGTLATGEGWENLFDNIREAARLARDAARALDEVFERKTSYNYEVAYTNKQIAEQTRIMRDASKTDNERIAAAKEVIRLEEQLGAKKREIWQQEAQANRDLFKAATGLNDEQVDYLVKNYNLNRESIKQARDYNDKVKEYQDTLTLYQRAYQETGTQASFNKYREAEDALIALQNATSQEIKDLAKLTKQYDKANDELVSNMANAEVAVINIDTEVIQASMRASTMLGSLQNQLKKTEDASDKTLNKPKYTHGDSLLKGIARAKSSVNGNLSSTDTLAGLDAWNAQQKKILQSNAEAWQEWMKDVSSVIDQFRSAVVGGFGSGVEEMMAQLMGLEETNSGALLQALLSPLADLATREGEIIMASGLGLEALQKELAAGGALGGAGAIAAGAALIAIGAATKSGLAALANNGGNGSAGTNYNGSGALSSAVQNMEMTIYVKGKISGKDIVISGERTTNYWNR